MRIIMDKREVLDEIIKDTYNINPKDYAVIDMIVSNYEHIVHDGFKGKNYIVGEYGGDIVSIEKKSLLELYKIIDELFK